MKPLQRRRIVHQVNKVQVLLCRNSISQEGATCVVFISDIDIDIDIDITNTAILCCISHEKMRLNMLHLIVNVRNFSGAAVSIPSFAR